MMNSSLTPKVLASAASGVIPLIEANRGDPDLIFGRSGIQSKDLENPTNELDLEQFCHLFTEASHQTGNDNFGLHFGSDFAPRRLGAIGYAAISSPTLATGLRNMETYFPAHQEQSSFGLIRDDDMLWLSYRINDPQIKDRRHDAELSMGMFLNIFRHALGPDWRPLEIRFEHARPERHLEHEELFGAPVQFGRRTNALAFRPADLDTPMPAADPYLYAIVEAFLQSRSELHEDPENFAESVRNQIKLNLSTTIPTIAEIAQLFGLSDHEFQHELHVHKLSFKSLLKAAREELSLHYLDNHDLPLTEVAILLGYSELSAFSRAFRNWTGMSPQRYRQSRRRSPKPHTV